jgi:hypothetical protein
MHPYPAKEVASNELIYLTAKHQVRVTHPYSELGYQSSQFCMARIWQFLGLGYSSIQEKQVCFSSE